MSAIATEPPSDGSALDIESHVKYIQGLDTKKDELDYWLTEHLRLNGVYWGLNALHLMGRPEALPRQETIDFIMSCQHESGGFGAAPGHDAHMLSTVSAVQVLVMVDALDELETKGKGRGKGQVGKCKMHSLKFNYGGANAFSKLSPTCKIEKPVASTVTNGAKRTPVSCVVP